MKLTILRRRDPEMVHSQSCSLITDRCLLTALQFLTIRGMDVFIYQSKRIISIVNPNYEYVKNPSCFSTGPHDGL